MQGMADQLVSKEEEFKEWQAKVLSLSLMILSNMVKYLMLIFFIKLAEQTKRERETLTEEFDEERLRFSERVAQLEDALNLANLEITRLTIEMAETTSSQRRMS